MAVQTPTPPNLIPTARRPDPPRRDEADGALAFIWILFAFKLVTLIMIFWAARTSETAIFLTLTHWFWAFIPAAILAGPILFRYRLIRVRRRREALRRAEFSRASTPKKSARRSTFWQWGTGDY